MSALAQALAHYSAAPDAARAPAALAPAPPSPSPSPSSSYSALPSLSSSATPSSSDIASLCPPQPSLYISCSVRPNEHLAVLLPKHLWKPDRLASKCDNFYCTVKFSILGRRHHCRKCGGVYCGHCTSRTTPLLDTTNLDFLHPPRNVPLTTFESPLSPIVPSRVCTDCWEQIHGCPTPRTPTPDLERSNPIYLHKKPLSSGSSSLSSSVATPPNGNPLVSSRRSLRTVPSNPALGTTRLRTSHTALPEALLEVASLEHEEPSYGPLDAYPLKRSSAVCKATGGGRWEPKQSPPHPGYRIPGGKAPFELDMEREEREERMRRLNPIVRDGDFQYRFPREDEAPLMMARSPFQLSTF